LNISISTFFPDGNFTGRRDRGNLLVREGGIMNLHDEIAAVAYELFESRGCSYGCDLDDWLSAEKIVLGRHAGQEIEEPEEEEGTEGIATVNVEKVRYDEADEPANEEMS
jgi:hypothetical protein